MHIMTLQEFKAKHLKNITALAKVMGIPASTLNNKISGQYKMTSDELAAMGKALIKMNIAAVEDFRKIKL